VKGSTFFGSSGNSGKRGADFQEEVGLVAKAMGNAFEDFDFVVDAFEGCWYAADSGSD
jgi:hypothetical protein